MPSIAVASRTYQDYGGEVSTMKVNSTPVTAANFTAQQGLLTDLWSAADAITLGGMIRNQWGNVFTDPNPVLPSNTAAQRENKWLVTYHDTTTGKKYWLEVPCADTAQLDPNDRDHAHIGDADVVDDFVAAFNAVVRSEFDNAVLVDEITYVGRNI